MLYPQNGDRISWPWILWRDFTLSIRLHRPCTGASWTSRACVSVSGGAGHVLIGLSCCVSSLTCDGISSMSTDWDDVRWHSCALLHVHTPACPSCRCQQWIIQHIITTASPLCVPVLLQGGPKKWGHKLMAIIRSNLNRFTQFFHWKIPS